MYRDFANITARDVDRLVPMSLVESNRSENGKSKDRYFPARLHYVLSDLEADGLSHIVSWQPHGRCFRVHQMDEFVEQVLCRWFNQSKYPSFQRQLNLYGFTRIASGPDQDSYYHEMFLRGKPYLAQRMRRVAVTPSIRKDGSSSNRNHHRRLGTNNLVSLAAPPPNFYAMPFLPLSSSSSNNDNDNDRLDRKDPPKMTGESYSSALSTTATLTMLPSPLAPLDTTSPPVMTSSMPGIQQYQAQSKGCHDMLLQRNDNDVLRRGDDDVKVQLLLRGVLQVPVRSAAGLLPREQQPQQSQQLQMLHNNVRSEMLLYNNGGSNNRMGATTLDSTLSQALQQQQLMASLSAPSSSLSPSLLTWLLMENNMYRSNYNNNYHRHNHT